MIMTKAKTMSVALSVIAIVMVAALVWTLAGERSRAAGTDASAGPERTNRLIHSTSPYLLQHAHNPVDWYPWGPEAFEKAKKEDKPIFLSVGYSTCHWCHVMAEESFEDEQIAEILNEHYVCIKVDREQHPDVDEQYILATQMFTGRAGWPNSVWLTPDGRPWFAGTYFPKPQFRQILLQLAKAWREQREQAEQQADQFVQAIQRVGSGEHLKTDKPLSRDAVDKALSFFAEAYDEKHGGFGGTPKFPPHGALSLLLYEQKRTSDLQQMSMIGHTLDAMMRGGVYDQVGGGFHRYATDARWFLPHFEKMLYDNALLIGTYADAHALTGDRDYRRVIEQTFQWLNRVMRHEAGGFYSGLDAGGKGEEGTYYVWTHQELIGVLGEEDGRLFAKVYGATEEGNYREEATGKKTGANIPYLPKPIGEAAKELEIDEEELRNRLEPMRQKLLEHRWEQRTLPHLDDKILAGWNGLMIGGLAKAGRLLETQRYTDAAAEAADFVLQKMRDGDQLMRAWRQGETSQHAYLDDYAYVARGLLELHETTGEQRWLDEARSLMGVLIDRFHDSEDGGFYTTSERHDELMIRAKDLGGGGNVPSGNGVAAQVLVRLAERTGEKRYAELAAGTLHALRGQVWSSPHGSEAIALATAQFFDRLEAGRIPEVEIPSAAPESDADAVVSQPPLMIEAFAAQNEVRPGQTVHVAVRVRIDEPYHIYGPELEQENLRPTVLRLRGPANASLGDVRYPEAKPVTDPVLNEQINMYEGTVTFLAPVTIGEQAEAGEAALELELEAQACDDKSCLAPERYSLRIPVKIDPEASEALRHKQIFEPLGVGGGE